MSLLDLLPFVAVVAVMWLLLMRPARKRQQEQVRMIAALAPGDRVMTTSGLLGTVVRVGDAVALEVAAGVVVEFVPQAIARVLPSAEPADREPDQLAVDLSESPSAPADPASTPPASLPAVTD